MDEEKSKGRTWNGYVCPGCRTVFRVAADFIGADVMCPSCKETLRLPKTPEEVPSHSTGPETPTISESTTSAEPAAPTRPDHQPQEAEPSALSAMLATHDGRLKLALALLIPLALVLGAMAFLPPEESAPGKVAQENTPPIQQETKAQEKPAPPPPPVAVSEMPVPPLPALPQPEKPPVQEVAVVQPVPEPSGLTAEPVAELVETVPESAPPIKTPDDGLVEAIPATPVPAPEKPAPSPAAQPEPKTTAASAELVHTVARGDTLNEISRKYQVSASTIKKANGMKSDAVMLGQKLKLPGAITPAAEPTPPPVVETPAQPQAARSHIVARGDTLERIARKYGVEARAIMQANGMKTDVVQLGRKLVIPAAP